MTPERRAEWRRSAESVCRDSAMGQTKYQALRVLQLLDALDAAEQRAERAEADAEDRTARNEAALNIALEYGQIDGGHHKAWVIDQMVRALTGVRYPEWVGDTWDEGIAP